MELDLDNTRSARELMNVSLGSYKKKSRLWGAGVAQKYCLVLFFWDWWVKHIPKGVYVSKCLCLESWVCFISFKCCYFRQKKNPHFHFLRYICHLFCCNDLCVNINFYKVPRDLTPLCNCVLFVPCISNISSFANKCLAGTCLILALLSKLQGGCTLWVNGGVLCFQTS